MPALFAAILVIAVQSDVDLINRIQLLCPGFMHNHGTLGYIGRVFLTSKLGGARWVLSAIRPLSVAINRWVSACSAGGHPDGIPWIRRPTWRCTRSKQMKYTGPALYWHQPSSSPMLYIVIEIPMGLLWSYYPIGVYKSVPPKHHSEFHSNSPAVAKNDDNDNCLWKPVCL